MILRTFIIVFLKLTSCDGVWLQGSDVSKLVKLSNNEYNFLYDDDSTLTLTCVRNNTQVHSTLMWLQGEEVMESSKLSGALSYSFSVSKKDSESQIICQNREKNGEIEKKIIIHLLHNSYDNVLVYIIAPLALVILITVILLIYVNKMKSQKKQISEDKIRLEMTEAFKSQSNESVSDELTLKENTLYKRSLHEISFVKKPMTDKLINPTLSDTYTSPNDDSSYDNPSLNCIIPNTYCAPFIGNGDDDLVSLGFRISNEADVVNYANTSHPIEIRKSGPQRINSTNNTTVNNKLSSKANVLNGNMYVSSEGSNQSNFYYEIMS